MLCSLSDLSFLHPCDTTDSFGAAPPTTTDAYIIYCMVVANVPGMEKEVQYLIQMTQDETFSDTYVMGLTAATLYHLGR